MLWIILIVLWKLNKIFYLFLIGIFEKIIVFNYFDFEKNCLLLILVILINVRGYG